MRTYKGFALHGAQSGGQEKYLLFIKREMNYDGLKKVERLEAIRLVLPPGTDLTDRIIESFPYFPEVIIFGGNYWKSNDLIADFINEYVKPKSEKDITKFLQDIVDRITSDPYLYDSDARKTVNIDYKRLYSQHASLYKSPDSLFDWAELKGDFMWFEYILSKRRAEQFENIVKEYDEDAMIKVARKIKQIYDFTEREITYLQYFCSQAKLEDLDPSFNTFLYLWSDEQFTGKSTVASYICSFLNGEKTRNVDPHKSKLEIEMQFAKFDRPKGVTSRCVFIDEGGFYDMKKTYNNFKDTITSNSCEIEYKFKNSRRTKRCYRNYIMTANPDPIYFVHADKERRILPIHFSKPENVSFAQLEKIWYEFVLECNIPAERMSEIYNNVVQPNSQAGENQNIILELKDIFTKERINACISTSYFSISNLMTFSEVINQKNSIDRKLIKEAIIQMYGKPDASQRFYKVNRIILESEAAEVLPF